jgi:DNA-binding beta-propeller fold protein YncE
MGVDKIADKNRERQGMNHRSIVFAALALLLVQSSDGPERGQARSQGSSQNRLPRILDSISVGGTGGWDYISCDAAARRLYVSHATRVEVLNVDTKLPEGVISNTPGVHGIAMAADLGRGFTSNGGDATVTVFDLKTLATIMRIDVTGKKPDAIMFEPVTRRVFTFNGGSDNCTAIDAAELKVVGTLALGGAPEFAVADGQGKIFVNIEDRNEVVCFDARNLAVLSRWPIAPCATPTGLSIDRKNRRLFVGGRNQLLAVLDADAGTVIATFPIGKGVDATVFDAEKSLVYASNKDGTLDVFREESPVRFTPLGRLPTVSGAKTMALDQQTHRVYLPSAHDNTANGGTRGEMYILVVGE